MTAKAYASSIENENTIARTCRIVDIRMARYRSRDCQAALKARTLMLRARSRAFARS
jgi:hypothetical protein